ncbi:MAG: DEAD/DEAH box helicase [Gemmatimonadetes bacterium]|nr:DEAD/DEAH box helicase [Gemmatimonadota bacterium]
METFDDLGLAPELVEALAAEGVERPTPLQEGAIPVIHRGNNLVAQGGPGGGTMVAWGAPLLDRVPADASGPRVLVATPTAEVARRLAESLGRLAQATGHAVASVGAPWVLPERATILFGAPSDLLSWVGQSRLDLAAVEALVVDGADQIQRLEGLESVEALLESLPGPAQRVVVTLPLTPEIEDLCERHLKRAVHVPPRAVSGAPPDKPPARGELRYRIVPDREEGALTLVSEVLEADEARHACLFLRSEDRAADVGDFLALHGFGSGRPGDESVPVWLAVDEMEARHALDAHEDGVVVISVDAPVGPDALDRRHGAGRGGYALVLPREMPHLRDVARRTGYTVIPFPPLPTHPENPLSRLLARLEEAVERDEMPAYLAALGPLMERRGAEELAAAALLLLREGGAAPEMAAAPVAGAGAAAAGSAPAAFVRLYVSLGERDGVGPGDLLGAMTGEAGIKGAQVGKIEIRDSFSLVEIERDAADKVIRGLNGVTVRGRAVRVDYDRGTRERPPRPGGGGGGAGTGDRRPAPTLGGACPPRRPHPTRRKARPRRVDGPRPLSVSDGGADPGGPGPLSPGGPPT